MTPKHGSNRERWILYQRAYKAARKIAQDDKVEMVIVEAPDDDTGEQAFEYCPAAAVHILYGHYMRSGLARIVEHVRV